MTEQERFYRRLNGVMDGGSSSSRSERTTISLAPGGNIILAVVCLIIVRFFMVWGSEGTAFGGHWFTNPISLSFIVMFGLLSVGSLFKSMKVCIYAVVVSPIMFLIMVNF